MPRKLVFKTSLSPGDLCTLTSAIDALHRTYPGLFVTDVRTPCDDLFKYNPFITPLDENDAEVIKVHYTDLIDRSDGVPNVFLRGYCFGLGKRLRMPLELTSNRPQDLSLAGGTECQAHFPISTEFRGVALK